MTTIVKQIARSTDDAEVRKDGSSYTDSANYHDPTGSATDGLRRYVGCRHDSWAIPRGAKITDARVEINVWVDTLDDIEADIALEDADEWKEVEDKKEHLSEKAFEG